MTVSDEQVEAAAVAIAQDADWMWPMTPPDIRDIFRRQARAALTAASSIGSEPITARAFIGHERFHIHGDVAYTIDNVSGACYGCLL